MTHLLMHVKRRLAVPLFAAFLSAALVPSAGALTARYAHTATLLPDGNILIVGGQSNDTPTIVGGVDVIAQERHVPIGASSGGNYVARSSHTATLLPTGEVLIAGGISAGGVNDTVQIYSPKYDCWRQTVQFKKAANIGRFNHTATLLKNGDVLICGGQGKQAYHVAPNNSDYSALQDCDLFIPAAANTLSPTCADTGGVMDNTGVSLQIPRTLHSATLLNDGRVYIVGGIDNTGNSSNSYLVTAEIYSPGSTITGAADGLITARAYHRATLMGNGKVLIVGGHNNQDKGADRGFLESTEIYDPVSDRTSPGGTLPARISEQAQTITSDGSVILAGGLGNVTTTYFNPSQTFSSTWSFISGCFGGGLDGTAVCNPPQQVNLPAVLSTMTIRDGYVELPIDVNLSERQTGVIVDGFILFSSPTLTFPGGHASFLPGVEDPVTGVLSGTYARLDSLTVGCNLSGVCGRVNARVVVHPAGQYYPNQRAVSASITAMGTSVVNWGPAGCPGAGGNNCVVVATGTATSALQYSSQFVGSNVTIGGLPMGMIGARISTATLHVTGGSATSVDSANNTLLTYAITDAWGKITSALPVTVQPTSDGQSGQITVDLAISSVTSGSVTSSTSTGLAGEVNLSGRALTGITGTFTYAVSSVTLEDTSADVFTVDVATIVIRKMLFADQIRYTPNTNSWADTRQSVSGLPAFFGASGTLTPGGDIWLYGGRQCFEPSLVTDPPRCSSIDPIAQNEVFVDQFAGLSAVGSSMGSPRANATVTLLPDGKMLIAGGNNGPNVLPTAELFDPSSQSFSPTAPMVTARDLHTATLLANGRVLVAGGFSTSSTSSGTTNSAEIYYPDVDAWLATSPMPFKADNMAATLLANGNVLVTGGFADGVYLSSAAVYISTMGVWRALPNMSTDGTASGEIKRAQHTATLLQDGRVLIAGGINQGGPMSSVLIYDPNYTGASRPWYADTALPTPLHSHTASLLKDGAVLVAGGANSFGETNSSFLYVPARAPSPDNAAAPGTWTNTATNGTSLNVPRLNHLAFTLPNGKVLVIGGAQALGNAVSQVEAFDVAGSSWQLVGPLSKARFNAMGGVAPDGTVYVFGGNNGVSIENTVESGYFTGTVDSLSLGVALGNRKPKVFSVDSKPFSGSAFSTIPQTNGPAVTITGQNLLGFGEASGGSGGTGGASHHGPRILLQSMAGSGGAGSQGTSGFTLDVTTEIYAAGIIDSTKLNGKPTGSDYGWGQADSSITLIMPNAVGTSAAPPGLGGTMLPYGWYQLRAYSNAVYSDSLQVQVGPPKPPLAPTSVQAAAGPPSGIGVSSVTWQWSMPAGMSANQIDGWEIFSSSNGVLIGTAAPSQLTFTQTSMAPGATAQISVAAFSASGDGPLGNSATYYTYCSSPAFTTAYGFSSTFTTVGFDSLTLQWDPDSNAPGTIYEVSQSTDNFQLNFSTPVPTVLALTSTGTVIPFLQTNTTYWFRVRAFNGFLQPSDFSVVVATRTRAPVSNLAGTAVDATTIQWRWRDPGGVNYFKVYNATVPFGQPGSVIATTGSAVYFDTGLSTNTSRTVMVSAVTDAGEGTLSPSATVYTMAAVPGPVSPPITNLSTGSFTALWTANGNPLGTQYQMTVSNAFNQVTTTITTTGFNSSLAGIAGGSTFFTAMVRAINGDGLASNFLVVGSSYTLPEGPTALSIVNTQLDSITVGWNTGTNTSSATYQVQFTTAPDFNNPGAVRTAEAFSQKFTGNVFTIPNLLTSTTYQIRVQASNPLGQVSSFSNSLTTSPFNGGVALGSLGVLISHTVTTTVSGAIGNNRVVTLQVPANAFPADTFITISTFDASGVNSPCSNGVDIGVNITPSPYIQPLHPVFFTVGYTPAELASVPTSQAALERVDPSGTCVPLQTSVDTTNNLITAQLNHFSSYQVANVAPASNPGQTVVFPNPFLPSQGNGYVTFKNTPASSRIRIFTVRGELVWEGASNGSGLATWGGVNKFGRAVASGVYLAVVEKDDDKKILKVVVLR